MPAGGGGMRGAPSAIRGGSTGARPVAPSTGSGAVRRGPAAPGYRRGPYYGGSGYYYGSPYYYGGFGLGWGPYDYYGGYYDLYDPFWADAYGYGYPPADYGYPLAETAEMGGIRLEVTPKSADVFVDGTLAGIVDDFDGTFQQLKLPAGPHHIELKASGYASTQFDVNIAPGHKLHYRDKMKKG